MDTFNKIALVAGILAVLVVAWLLFAPVNEISKGLQPIVDNATENTTLIATADGTLSTFNSFQDTLISGLWFIIIGGIVFFAVIIFISHNKSGGNMPEY